MQISDHRQYKPKPGVSYVGHSVDKKFVHIWERDNNTGERRRVSFNIRPYCYMHDPIGYRQNPESYVYESIYGDKAEKIEFRNMAALKNFKKEIEFENLKRSKQTRITLFESDFSPLDRVLMDCYYGASTPKLNYVFLDIETDYDPSKPFSAPTYHPGTNVPNEKVMYAPINAAALYRSWSKDYVTIAVPPKGWVGDLGKELDLSELGDGSTVKSKFIMVGDEVELLKTFLRETANADVYSGWNSEFFDMPYMTMRTKILEEQGKGISIADWSLEYANEIRFAEQESFGEKRPKADFDPTGFNHLDYLLCLKKFTFGSRPSYKLASIAEDELKIPKLDYEGSLADLYKNDFKRFVQYNTRDVEIVVKLDEKFSFMNLAVQLSHANTTNLGAVMGTVRYVETGITNFAHRIMKKIVNDKIAHTPGPKVEGAIVLSPKIGLHEWIASVDIQSLYPNILRSINGSPEKMIGQFLDGEKVWKAIRNKQYDVPCSLVLNGEEDSEAHTMSAGEWAALFVKEKWCLTAYGTVFDQSNGKGLLTIVIETWFAERKALKAELSKWEKKEEELERAGITSGKEWDHVQHQIAHYDLLQLTKKIQLNSTYGALLNEHFRYYRLEIGASITASGRQVTTHMIGTIGEIIVGEFSSLTSKLEHRPDGSVGKLYFTDAKSPVHYSDTDSQHGGAILRTSLGVMTFEETFSTADFVIVDKGRELAQFTEPLRVLSYDPESEKVEMKEVDMIYRHRVTKERFDIELENGFKTSVTGDHSLMVERNGKLIEIKARDIQDDDIFITLHFGENAYVHTHLERVSITGVFASSFDAEYVYDVVMSDSTRPYYFGDDILVHNSCYFATFMDNREDAARVADDVCAKVNESFPTFMREAFFCNDGYDTHIKACREIVGERGLFIAKKKYVIKVVDDGGKAVNKIKTMGSEIKKSDTPRPIQVFMKSVVSKILDGEGYPALEEFVNAQRKTIFSKMSMVDVIDIGVAKSANNLKEKYEEYLKFEKPGRRKVNLPGHIRAAVNFNELGKRFEGDGATMLQSGDKVKVFYLKANDLDLKAIAFPSDISHFPAWFVEHFRVDKRLTEEKMIDSKLEKIFAAWGYPVPDIQTAFKKSVLKF